MFVLIPFEIVQSHSVVLQHHRMRQFRIKKKKNDEKLLSLVSITLFDAIHSNASLSLALCRTFGHDCTSIRPLIPKYKGSDNSSKSEIKGTVSREDTECIFTFTSPVNKVQNCPVLVEPSLGTRNCHPYDTSPQRPFYHHHHHLQDPYVPSSLQINMNPKALCSKVGQVY